MTERDQSTTLRVRPVPASSEERGGGEAQLVVLVGHAIGRRYVIKSDVELGRGPHSALEVLDHGVSRRHASIERAASGSYEIHDLGSRNGTYVNGARVEHAVLSFGDKIAIGSQTVLLFAERDRFDDQRIQAQKLQAVGELAGGIAHDFNNLLGVVLANITHLQGLPRLDEGAVRSALAEVETAARRAVDLTQQLSAFARSGGREHRNVDVADLLANAHALVRRTLHRQVTFDVDAPRGPVVVGDAGQLLQVLTILCINAADVMPEGGRIDISAACCEFDTAEISDDVAMSSGTYVVIRVRDNGVGMDATTRARVFEPFFTTKPRGKGTGLGLATAQAIVRDHGGRITVDSALGEGTVFEIRLPAATSVRGSRLTQEVGPPMRGVVLLADDEELVRFASRRVLEHVGLEVVTASDGQEAVDLHATHGARIDLVVLDLDMPRLGGEEAYALLRARNPALRVLVCSGYLDGERERVLREAGVNGFVRKPYDSLTLLQAVGAALLSKPAAAP